MSLKLKTKKARTNRAFKIYLEKNLNLHRLLRKRRCSHLLPRHRLYRHHHEFHILLHGHRQTPQTPPFKNIFENFFDSAKNGSAKHP